MRVVRYFAKALGIFFGKAGIVVVLCASQVLELDAPLPKEKVWQLPASERTLCAEGGINNENSSFVVQVGEEKDADFKSDCFEALSIHEIPQDGSLQSSIGIEYGFHLPSMQTTRDLRKMWNMVLIQQMTNQRLAKKQCCLSLPELSSFLLPGKVMAYQISSAEMGIFLHSMQEIKQVGFTIEELSRAKLLFTAKILDLQKEYHEKQTPLAAAFHAEGFLHNIGYLSYAYFLDSAISLIDSITPVDIAIVLNECFKEESRLVKLFAQHSELERLRLHVQQQIENSTQLTISEFSETVATEMEPCSSEGSELFYLLPLNEEDKKIIYTIIDTMARDNVLKLGMKRKSMERKGKKIRHVHPLRFLGYVFSDKHLHRCMNEVSHSSFKWHGFVDGFKDRIKEEAARNNLLPYIASFGKLVNVDEKKLRRCIEEHDWEGLVRVLL